MNFVATILSQPRKYAWLSISLALAGVFLLVQPASAQFQNAISLVLGFIILLVVQFLGSVLLLLIEILIGVFSFTEFIDTPAVQLGWVVMRDLSNVAIVVALIIIAFSTVFRIQRYAAGQLLVRLIIAAFLVNFSLLIAGLLIDFGQVVMMTFVHEFQNLAAGNLTAGFGIEEMLTVAKSNVDIGGGGVLEGESGLIGALLLAVVLLVVACAVVLVMIVVLLQRIIYLWVLAIFSPIAWVAPLLPGGASYSSQWWSTFTKQLFVGPILAFGFWLSMSILSGLSAQQSLISLRIQNTEIDPAVEGSERIARFVSEVSTPQAVFDFMVTIALLLGTLAMAKQAGGAAASFAGSVSSKLQTTGIKLAKGTARKVGVAGAVGAALGPLGVAGAMLARSQMRRGFAGKGTILSTPARIFGAKGKAFADKMEQKLGSKGALSAIAKDRQRALDEKKQKQYKKFFEEKLGLGEESGVHVEKFFGSKLLKPFFSNAAEAGKLMSADVRSAINFVSAGAASGGQVDIGGMDSHQLYNSLTGVTPRIKKVLARVTTAFATNFKIATTTMTEAQVRAWMQAIASYRKKTGKDSPELKSMEYALDNAPGHLAGATTKGYETTVSYSKTDIDKFDTLKRHEEQKKRYEGFSQKPENQGKSEEQMKKEFFSSEQAKQGWQAGNVAVGRFVDEAGQQGAGSGDFAGIINTDQLTVNAQNQPQFVAPEMPAPDVMQAEYDEREAALKPFRPASEDGVTVGGFGRQAGNNIVSVGFDKVNEEMQKQGVGDIAGIVYVGSEGLILRGHRGVSVGAALSAILTEQMAKLKSAQTPAEKAEALKYFGYKPTDENNPASVQEFMGNIDGFMARAQGKGEAALNKLNDEDLIRQEGLVMINKNRLPGSALGLTKHEVAHDYYDQIDPDREKFGALAKDLQTNQPEVWKRIQGNIKSRRKDAGKLSTVQTLEEYAADAQTGRVDDPELRVILNEAGLAKRKGAVSQAQKIDVTASGNLIVKSEAGAVGELELPTGSTGVGLGFDESAVQKIVESLTPDIQNKIDLFLRGRDNFLSMTLSDKFEAYKTAVRGGLVRDTDFMNRFLKQERKVSKVLEFTTEHKNEEGQPPLQKAT